MLLLVLFNELLYWLKSSISTLYCERLWSLRHPSLRTAMLISHYLNSMVDFFVPIYDTITIKVFPLCFCACSDGENISSHFLFTMCVTLGPPYRLQLSSSGGKLQDWRHFKGITEIRPDTNGISCWGRGGREGRGTLGGYGGRNWALHTHLQIYMWIRAKAGNEGRTRVLCVCVCVCAHWQVSVSMSKRPLAHQCTTDRLVSQINTPQCSGTATSPAWRSWLIVPVHSVLFLSIQHPLHLSLLHLLFTSLHVLESFWIFFPYVTLRSICIPTDQ